MTVTSIGDLARGYVLRSRNTALNQTLTRLTKEVASGRTSDPAARLNGHFSYLSQIEHDLTVAASYGAGAKEVQISASTMQAALGQIGEMTDELLGTLTIAATGAGPTDITSVASDARGTVESTIAALNSSVAGRHLFSGAAVDRPALAEADILLSELRSSMAGAVSPADARAAADAFFDTPGGGFETLVYGGSTTSLAPVQLGAGESADLNLRADHVAFRETLKNAALVALADDPGLALDEGARRGLFGDALDGLLSARDAQVVVRADLGFAEERIARASTRVEAEISGLQIARNELLEVDPFEAATELEAVQLQLETLYTVTARTSRLSLVNFLS